MLDIKQLKKDYQLKFFEVKEENKRIYIRELTHYIGSNKFRIIYEENLGEIKYLNDISKNDFIEFIEKLIIPEKPKEQIIMDTKKVIIDNYTQVNNIYNLSDRLYTIVNDLYIDKISIEKAIAISKISQTILNIEKQKSLLKNI